ncbi:UDP-glucose--hexose-1-phosphate uridylyltransferase [Alkalihalobacillus trypoxylicola]|uniref:Galactose-1-phosphate uridylyltransferase n=1 Tax=Alkalihalobacillus trypoxylicola TaxID=519424 RepID=A0A162E5P6_9BACI|nr:UDP-glucose--hexose-1-phosphate uridylyltransferase [Alkalihalobacillus trypoxylicola]KYG31800.1 galactose-1-phosphate uridylyltransferase [Alkalihalobacillus trypoxylicola]
MSVNIYEQIERLIQFGQKKGLLSKWDVDETRNRILAVLQLDDFQTQKVEDEELQSPVPILEQMLDWAVNQSLIEENTVTYRDLFDTKIMGCMTPRQSEVIRHFNENYHSVGPEKATEDFYEQSKNLHYIRTDRIAKNEHWYTKSDYGDLEITINLSKPEKDPKAIAAAKKMKTSEYPLCLLCKENVGYQGRINHPARQNHRIIPVDLIEEQWYLQFSPYVYYEQHAIIFRGEHVPMKISKKTFERLLMFIKQFDHYFLGSNADLPIVGGSILSHDHFQGGYHTFPMAVAEVEHSFDLVHFPGVTASIVRWPMSVIRLQGIEISALIEAADFIFNRWKQYEDQSVEIIPFTGDEPHNTVTPIARKNNDTYELDLVLRNNRTSGEFPDGIFHPHQEVHHLKKENIGLIEVMGLAVLPGRLKEELALLAEALLESNPKTVIENHPDISKHLDWGLKIKEQYQGQLNENTVMDILKKEVGLTFETILEHAGVFKRTQEGTEAFIRFMKHLN